MVVFGGEYVVMQGVGASMVMAKFVRIMVLVASTMHLQSKEVPGYLEKCRGN